MCATIRNGQVTELELIIDLHKNADRQGPGSENDTLKALGFLDLPNTISSRAVS